MKPSIYYTHPGLSSFVKKDIDIFKKHFNLKVFEFKPANKFLTPLVFLRHFFSLLFHFFSTDIFICQFGGYQSFFPALLSKISGKRCLVIAGGTDTVSFPSINYGNFNKGILGKITEWSFRWCTHISPVSETLMLYDYTYQPDDFPKQGIKYFCKNIKTPYTVIYNGYEADKWKNNSLKKIENSFITVAFGLEKESRFKLKGIDLIFAVAPLFPQCQFTVVGLSVDSGVKIPSNNIVAIPALPNERLISLYSQNEFYLQLSMSEGFPNAISEAMLCGCIPLGSKVGAIPEIIRDGGFILERKDVGQLVKLVQSALKADKQVTSKRARQTIIENFPLGRRENELSALITKLISAKRG